MSQHQSAIGASQLPTPQPELDLGQHVRILRGEHRGVTGRVIACEWDANSEEWSYFVKDSRVEFGPYNAKELW